MAYFHCLIGGGSSGGGYELTVTCDADFAGTTITCTDGVTTLTQTCPSASPYEVVFAIPNGGDWTISGVVSGQTITTGVNIPTTATLEAIVQKTITIYSAKEDTITYTDIYGDTQTEVFASGQTSKQITIDININGSSITFTSGVAKDPSDLTAYYSKTVTIDSNSTGVYLMPETACYWYGFKASNYATAIGVPGNSSNGSAPIENTNSLTLNSHWMCVGGSETFDNIATLKTIVEGNANGLYPEIVKPSDHTYYRQGTPIGNGSLQVVSTSVSSMSGTATLTGQSVNYGYIHDNGSYTIYAIWYE